MREEENNSGEMGFWIVQEGVLGHGIPRSFSCRGTSRASLRRRRATPAEFLAWYGLGQQWSVPGCRLLDPSRRSTAGGVGGAKRFCAFKTELSSMTDGLRIQSNNYISRDTAKGPDWVSAARHADQHETEQRGTRACVAAEGIGEAKDGGGPTE